MKEQKKLYVCTLDNALASCRFREEDLLHCKSMTGCGYCLEEMENIVPRSYIRKERWYEKYYR